MDPFDKGMLVLIGLLISPLIIGALALLVVAITDPGCATR